MAKSKSIPATKLTEPFTFREKNRGAQPGEGFVSVFEIYSFF